MPSPFPGMDPYLESHWRDVHARLIVYISDQMVGHKLGEFAMTRTFKGHSADRKTAAAPAKK